MTAETELLGRNVAQRGLTSRANLERAIRILRRHLAVRKRFDAHILVRRMGLGVGFSAVVDVNYLDRRIDSSEMLLVLTRCLT